MTINSDGTVFLRAGLLCCIGAAVAFATLSGCSSTGNSAGPSTGAKDTATFPNLNVPAPVAAQQLTDQEAAAKLAQLKAAKQGQGSKGGAVKVANQASLTTLAKKHGSDTLKQIEGKCDPTLDPTCK